MLKCEIFAVLVTLHILTGSQTYKVRCKNDYELMKKDGALIIGRFARVKPRQSIYNSGAYPSFRCEAGYSIEGYSKDLPTWRLCLADGSWNDPWPLCRGPLENVTCLNEYQNAYITAKSWLNPTPNRKHALYSPIQTNYRHGDTLHFRCSVGLNFKGSKGLVVMTTTCRDTGEWTKEWPMCKGFNCECLRVENGITTDENVHLIPGVQIDIKCHSGYYLWGSNKSICLPSLQWSHLAWCMNLSRFKKECEIDGQVLKIRDHSPNIPYCYAEAIPVPITTKVNAQLAIGIGIPVCIALCVSFIAATMYVRNHRLSRGYTEGRDVSVRYNNNDHGLHFILPTYDEAVKSKPTTPPPTFEESMGVSPTDVSSTPLISVTPSSHVYGSPPSYEVAVSANDPSTTGAEDNEVITSADQLSITDVADNSTSDSSINQLPITGIGGTTDTSVADHHNNHTTWV